MLKILNNNQAGSKDLHEPRLIGDILREYFVYSNNPLTAAYHKRKKMERVTKPNFRYNEEKK